jgi:hypothetical protein
LGLSQAVEEGQVVLGRADDVGAVFAPVERMLDEAISDRTGLARHANKLTRQAEPVKRKKN